MDQVLIGVDAGTTVIKAVVFTVDGRTLGSGEEPTQTSSPRAHWQERDLDDAWLRCAGAIGRALVDAHVSADQVASIGLCGPGDGAYLVDADQRPVRPGILSTDSRAQAFATEWGTGPDAQRILDLTGQVPYAASAPPLIRWLRENEPDSYERTAAYLQCKDWLRLRLTGEVATDVSDGSGSFVDLQTPAWSQEALQVYGMTDFADRLPPLLGSMELAGSVTVEAAAATGLRVGTPVVAGCHDVHAASVGLGADADGDCSVLMGTWSINQVVSTRPEVDPTWQCRHSVHPNRWLNMSSSPASSNNVDWICRVTGTSSRDRTSPTWMHAWGLLGTDDVPLFLPYLYGGPFGGGIGGAFAGLHGWHEPAHLIAAVLEGVVFNHWTHLGYLEGTFGRPRRIRAAGGGTRSPQVCQLLADLTATPVEVVDVAEPGALGVATMAGHAVGLLDLRASDRQVPVRGVFEPDAARTPRLRERFAEYTELSGAAVRLAQ